MAKFVVGTPVTTTTPSIVVDAGLAIGAHRFRLCVVDSSGNTSAAVEAVVTVRAIRPTPTPIPIPIPTPIPAPTPQPIAQPSAPARTRAPKKPTRKPS